MRRSPLLAAMLAVLFVVLTYFLIQGTSINAPHRERTDALQAVILHDAALQRDVLRSRAGLLPSYDPLVRSIDGLRTAVADLRLAAAAATGAAAADIGSRTAAVARAVAEQEALVESFKSSNALLQNSLSYFNHLSGRLTTGGNGAAGAGVGIGALATAMFRFVNAPRPALAREVMQAIDALERSAAPRPLTGDTRSLVAHARLIATTLPEVDNLVARIQSTPLGDLARTLERTYLEALSEAGRRANIFMGLLYGVAIALMGYIAHLFSRLRTSRDRLRKRLALERLVSDVSSRFINLPRDEVVPAAHKALAQLATHLDITGAELMLPPPGPAASPRPGAAGPDDGPPADSLAALVERWSLEGFAVGGCGCLYVPDVLRLPESREKAALREREIGALLAIPIEMAGQRSGAMILFHERPLSWQADDVALLQTVAEVFANAIMRARGEAEREDLQLRLNRSQRLEAIGTLAGGIAHEFNNILGAIRGYGEMALAGLGENLRARRHVTQILKAGDKAQDIVEQVLAFGRRRTREQRLLAIQAVVGEAIALVRASLPASVSLRTALAAPDAFVLGDPTELQQVVVNLATNAAQAMNNRGVIHIDLEVFPLQHRLDLSHGRIGGGRHVRLRVCDAGHGIDPAAMERIFEPFFTTKPAGKGTGLGLSTVHGIVAGHRGAIDVCSRPGEGTTFSVYFPAIEASAGGGAGGGGAVAHGQGETILIVEADRAQLALTEEMLAALGYEPVGFDQSEAALAALRARPERFDLVLADALLAALAGAGFAQAVHDIRPDMPVVLMSDGHGVDSAGLLAAGFLEVLRKPLAAADLDRCLARELAARPEPAHMSSASGSPMPREA